MNIAILLVLIGNSLILSICGIALLVVCHENKTKLYKRCGKLEAENEALKGERDCALKRYTENAKKFPVKSKYKPGAQVFCIVNDIVYHGCINAVIAKQDTTFCYEVLYKDDRTITAKEENVYLEDKPTFN